MANNEIMTGPWFAEHATTVGVGFIGVGSLVFLGSLIPESSKPQDATNLMRNSGLITAAVPAVIFILGKIAHRNNHF